MPLHPEARATYLIGRLDRIVSRRLDEVLGPLGLTLAQYTALSVLASRPGLTNAQLARRSLVTPQGMNQALSGLEGRGLITRRQHARRGRMLEIHLTEDGLALLAACRREAEAVEEQLLARLPVDDRDRFIESLRALTELGVPPA